MSEITLLTVYDKVAGMDSKLDAHMARTDEQLRQGAEIMRDHEDRLRDLKDMIPDGLKAELASLRLTAERRRGMSTVMQALLTFIGSSTVAALVVWLLTRHP